MKIAFVVDSLNKKDGGVAANYISRFITYKSFFTWNYIIFTKKADRKLGYDFKRIVVSKSNCISWLVDFNKIKDYDIVVIDGLWSPYLLLACIFARIHHKRYIVVPHGMLLPWSVNQASVKKSVAWQLYQKNILTHARCIIATSEMEADCIRGFTDKTPIKILPNYITFNGLSSPISHRSKHVIFVSRLHSKKGLEILIEAWDSLLHDCVNDEWKLTIIGDGDPNYVQSLHDLVKRKNLNECVFFTGHLDGDDLYHYYSNASIFVLPTSSENFGNVILEALSFGMIVITTVHTPWLSIRDFDCGEIINNNLEELAASLKRMIILDESNVFSKRQRSKELAKSFLPEIVSQKFDEILVALQ